MKKIFVLNNRGRLANQLWLAASVYAYCLEKKYFYINYAFFNYQHFFGIKTKNLFVDYVLATLPKKISTILYLTYCRLLRIFHSNYIVDDKKTNFLLPPSLNEVESQQEDIDKIENLNHDIYLWGWAFRNPIGWEKYRQEIKEFFKPNRKYLVSSEEKINEAKKMGDVLVGIHVRHGDFKTWNNGEHYYTFLETRKIVEDFLKKQDQTTKYVFLICSDDKIDGECFSGLNFVIGPGQVVGDLYALAGCDIVIGSPGTYGPWAAYYGNIPFVKFSRGLINWPIVTKKN